MRPFDVVIAPPCLDDELGLGWAAIETVEEGVDRSIATASPSTGSVSAPARVSAEIAVDVAACEMVPLFGPLIERHGEAIAQRIRDLVERGYALGAQGHEDLRHRRASFEAVVNALFKRFDILIRPSPYHAAR